MTTGGHGTQCRQVLLVRHGQSLHNAHHDGTDGDGDVPRDPMLSELGHAQAASLRSVPIVSAGCELLVVSPLSRAIQTASAVFGELPLCRTVLTPLHSERWCSIADEGRSKSELLQLFPFVASWEGFAELLEDWTKTGKEASWKTERVPAFLDWLAAQPEQRIVVIGHGAFFAALLGRYLQNCEVAEFAESPMGGHERLRGWQGL
mmetsp:Transcript_13777/g.23693  ORF Transcript_13777/g.23693 Transcript_13777/m.23693 type:complete len:205 (+) Transcript_13777:58-672(+)